MIWIIILSMFVLDKYDKLSGRYKELINYLIVGGLTTVVSISSYYLVRLVIDNYLLCTVFSWIIAVLFAYVANRKYVFHSKKKNIAKEFSEFVFSRILSLLAEIAVMFILVDFIGIPDRLSKIIVQFIIIVLNYIFSKLFVFKERD